MDTIKPTKQELTAQQWEFFQQIWRELEKKECESCGCKIWGPPKPLYFDHLLEKNKYPHLRFERDNIFIVCGDCHQKKNMGYPTKVHQVAIKKAEMLLLKQ